MANKVDVFTEELSKVFTILQQQYVMIKYMKALITSGELDETEINKLKEQITLINTNIDTIMNDQIVPIKQNIERIEQGMGTIEKVIPTDINVDSNGNLILEHDGQEITGQKKQVLIPKWALNKNKFFTSGNTIYISDFYTDYVQIYGETPEDLYINIDYNGISFLLGNGKQFTINYNKTKNALEFTDTVNKTVYLIPKTDNDTILTDHNVKTINGENICGQGDITISSGGKLYRHQLTLHATDGEYTTCFLDIYSSNNLKVDSLQDLTTLLKPNANTIYTGISTVTTGMPNLYLKYKNNIWQIGEAGETDDILNPVTSVEDIVTTI